MYDDIHVGQVDKVLFPENRSLIPTSRMSGSSYIQQQFVGSLRLNNGLERYMGWLCTNKFCQARFRDTFSYGSTMAGTIIMGTMVRDPSGRRQWSSDIREVY